MVAITEFSRNAQRAICMVFAAVIVMANIALGGAIAESALPGYAITITQL